MAEKIETRLLTTADIPAADKLRDIAGWNQTFADWRRLLALEPHGCFAAIDDGQILGTATTTTFGNDLAWIGMVLVEPSRRNRGIGRHLLATCLDYLRGKKVRCIKLDASPAGQGLYEKLGFQVEWGLTRWMRAGDEVSKNSVHALELTADDWREILRLDHSAFGFSRDVFLKDLGQNSLRIARHRIEDDFGFGFLRSGARADYLGPVVAQTEEIGRIVIDQLLSHSQRPLFWDIPAPCTGASSYAQSLGFTPQRPFMRMHLGVNHSPGQPENLWGISDPATG